MSGLRPPERVGAGEVDGDALIRPRARCVGRVVGLFTLRTLATGAALSMSMLPWLAPLLLPALSVQVVLGPDLSAA